jgi:hypothetical protein
MNELRQKADRTGAVCFWVILINPIAPSKAYGDIGKALQKPIPLVM